MYLVTGRPYLPSAHNPAIHHNDVTTVSTPMRAMVASASRPVTSCSTNTAQATYSSGPVPIMIRAVALMPPTVSTTRANRAGSRQPPLRRAWAVRPIIQGRAAQGSRMTEMRAAYSSRYGLSM